MRLFLTILGILLALIACKKENLPSTTTEGSPIVQQPSCICEKPYADNYGQLSTNYSPWNTLDCYNKCSFSGEVFFYVGNVPGYSYPYYSGYATGSSPSTYQFVYVTLSYPDTTSATSPPIPTCNMDSVYTTTYKSKNVIPEVVNNDTVAYYFTRQHSFHQGSPHKSFEFQFKVYVWQKNNPNKPCTAVKIDSSIAVNWNN